MKPIFEKAHFAQFHAQIFIGIDGKFPSEFHVVQRMHRLHDPPPTVFFPLQQTGIPLSIDSKKVARISSPAAIFGIV
jgi:hypothetical protein